MSNVRRFEAGPVSGWMTWGFKHPRFSKPAPGKLFLGEKLALNGMEVSLNTLPAGVAVPFLHRHRHHEEVYIFLAGEGEFQVAGERFPVTEGSAVRVAPAGERTWRNTGQTPLVYLVVQAVEGSLERHGIDDGEVLDRPAVWAR
ncbi:MAG: cupin domain-containing protein [Ectothiorhodospiraceae bacterium]|nr:cupin domain-containing protein [Ectothiorhodospiraceae bacterium]